LLRNKKFEKAREQYKRYLSSAALKTKWSLKLAACDSAVTWSKQRRLLQGDEREENEQYLCRLGRKLFE
jgi:hypothetical protein